MLIACSMLKISHKGQVAQLVEQRTENPCVDGSIPSLATKFQFLAAKADLASSVT